MSHKNKQKKKEYDKEYYSKNREKILGKAKTEESLKRQRSYQSRKRQTEREKIVLLNNEFIKNNGLVEHPSFPGYYGTIDGKVFSNKGAYGSLRELKPTIQKNNNGYLSLVLKVNNKRIQILHHRFIAQIFLPNPENFNEINHIDKNKSNNSVKNLEWCDRKYNASFSLAKKYLIENIKTGERYVIENLSDWCKDNNLSLVSAHKVCNGMLKKTKNFIICRCEVEFK